MLNICESGLFFLEIVIVCIIIGNNSYENVYD